ncbi:MAG: transcriptional regulator FtsR [Propionibacteriaceae bacterium]
MPKVARSIGQVLSIVKMEFPDISISKIRFLESEGLVSPERAPSGYRKYSDSDVDRLRYILQMQKNHYLPLKVIREHLDMIDRGLTPPSIDSPQPSLPDIDSSQEGSKQDGSEPSASALQSEQVLRRPQPKPPIRMTRRELIEASGLSEAMLVELERQFIIQTRRGTAHYGREALTLAVVARKLATYGIDARHLRAIKQAAEREVALIEDAIAPHLRRANSREVAGEVTQLVTHAHAALMRQAMSP